MLVLKVPLLTLVALVDEDLVIQHFFVYLGLYLFAFSIFFVLPLSEEHYSIVIIIITNPIYKKGESLTLFLCPCFIIAILYCDLIIQHDI